MQPVQVPRTQFDQIGMDILGPLPTSTAGNCWVIVTTDYLTRYAKTGYPKEHRSRSGEIFYRKYCAMPWCRAILLCHGEGWLLCYATENKKAWTVHINAIVIKRSQTLFCIPVKII
uniref:Putative tick transposon n=1 Tax=Rhipicephalus microplus TaxID=6941 RepID=A0A6G5AFR5_RHIMP